MSKKLNNVIRTLTAMVREAADDKLYHVVAINEKTGKKDYLTKTPEPHNRAVTMKNKFTPHKNVRIQLEPAEEATEETAAAPRAKVVSWMRANAKDYVDRKTGEVNYTGLAEGAASEFDMHDALDDETHWIWDAAISAGDAGTRSRR